MTSHRAAINGAIKAYLAGEEFARFHALTEWGSPDEFVDMMDFIHQKFSEYHELHKNDVRENGNEKEFKILIFTKCTRS